MKQLKIKFLKAVGLHKLLLAMLAALLLASCSMLGGSKEEPNEPIPAWFINPNSVAKDARYLYGTGSHSNKTQAVRLGLNEIAATLSVSVKSSSVSNRFKSGTSTSNSFNENVEAEVQKIEFKNYEVDQQALANKKYYVLVKVLKSGLLESTRQSFEAIDREVKNSFQEASSLDKLNKFFVIKKAESKINEGFSKLTFLSGMRDLDPHSEFDSNTVEQDTLRYEDYRNQLNSMLRNIYFAVTAEPAFAGIARAVSGALTEAGVKSSPNLNSSDGEINIGGQITHAEVQGYKSAQFSLSITVKDSSGKTLQTITGNITGYSPTSNQAAEEDAGIKYKKEVIDKKGGILKVLSL